MKEFKFSYFSRGNSDLAKILASNRLLTLMKWIDQNEIAIHFTILDYLYFGISDIIDSLPNIKETFLFNRQMKDELYQVIKPNINEFFELFFNFDYPNISKEKRVDFLAKLYDVYMSKVKYDNFDVHDFPKELLRQMIKSAKSEPELVFLHDNEPHVLFSTYASIYIDRPVRFPNAKHVFDEVNDVKEQLKKWDAEYEKKLNCHFVDSETEFFVQLSDVVVSLISRLSFQILHLNYNDIIGFVSRLDDNQKNVIRLLFKSINRGVYVSDFYNQSIAPNSFLEKQAFLVNILGKGNI